MFCVLLLLGVKVELLCVEEVLLSSLSGALHFHSTYTPKTKVDIVSIGASGNSYEMDYQVANADCVC